jgi:predicted peptidase
MNGEEKHFKGELTKQVSLDYLLYYPKEYTNNQAEKWPLTLFLHGIGERGNDVGTLKRSGLPKLAAEGGKFPFFLAAPQCPKDSLWTLKLDSLYALIKKLIDNYPVDTERIYLTGLSMGGYGVWHLAEAYPNLFAALVPICGGTRKKVGFPERIRVLADTPIWVFHGRRDKIVPIRESKRLVEELKECDGQVEFTVYPDGGHNVWDRTYQNDKLYDWLLAQKNDNFSLQPRGVRG